MAVLLGLLPTLLPILGLFGLYVAVLAVIPGARVRGRNAALALIFTGAMLYTLTYPFAVAPGWCLMRAAPFWPLPPCLAGRGWEVSPRWPAVCTGCSWAVPVRWPVRSGWC
ncbi:hypothetical protein ACFSQE_00580 [Vogesella fluminis]|uniref:hypothetical protein n=1 Tax=Vogesella fluminis TaxID=1069161 RepID=UPI00362A39C7